MIRALIVLSLVLIVGCDGHTVLSGNVVNGDGEPLVNARIKLTQNGHRVGVDESSDEGAFCVGGCHEPSRDPLDLVVEMKGYRTESRRVTPETLTEMRIVLERK
ncbi:MAG: carboxypeptidase-like regulatory domain-containing protein [Planctomycetota bacterium]